MCDGCYNRWCASIIGDKTPSTCMPVHASIERSEDGNCTVWLSEHDSMSTQKGMVGVCLYPGKSIVEAKARLLTEHHCREPFSGGPTLGCGSTSNIRRSFLLMSLLWLIMPSGH